MLVTVLVACAGGFFLLRAQRKKQPAPPPAHASATIGEQSPEQMASAATALSQHMAGIRQVG